MWRAEAGLFGLCLEGVLVLGRGPGGRGSRGGQRGVTGSHWEMWMLRTRGALSYSRARSPAPVYCVEWPFGPGRVSSCAGGGPAFGRSRALPIWVEEAPSCCCTLSLSHAAAPGPGLAGSEGHPQACEPQGRAQKTLEADRAHESAAVAWAPPAPRGQLRKAAWPSSATLTRRL